MPKISLNPDIVFLGFLPPLLFGAAFTTSWRDFRYNLVSICFLAFGLVGFTAFGIAAAAHGCHCRKFHRSQTRPAEADYRRS
jgi:monovalent cation/hydrogen antiporter